MQAIQHIVTVHMQTEVIPVRTHAYWSRCTNWLRRPINRVDIFQRSAKQKTEKEEAERLTKQQVDMEEA